MATYYVIAFADIAGSTRLYESVGDARAKNLITGLQTRIVDAIAEGGGQVQEIIGDEVMFHFDDIDAGALCACEIQEIGRRYSEEAGERLSVRIGLHYGPILMEDNRMFGDTINTAARMVDIAQGGQILLTEEIASRLTGTQKALIRRFDEVKVKGKQESLVVFDLLWRPTNVTMITPASTTMIKRPPMLELRYGDKEYRLAGDGKIFTIGRNAENDLIIDLDSVSRRHATIEFRRNRFFLADTSTNGTHVRPDGGEPIYLRRQSMPLWGRGQFSVGAPLDASQLNLILYHSSRPVRDPD